MVACRVSGMDKHQPVLIDEVIQYLAIDKDGIYLDATFGRGGHSEAILNQLGKKGKVIAFDKDPAAITYAQKKFSRDKRLQIFHGSFATIVEHIEQLQLTGKISGILFDLGVSSPQLDDATRGFSFMRNGKLDMRMNTKEGISAAEWLAKTSEQELATVLHELGEERYAKRIAKAIISARDLEPIVTTQQLANIIKLAHPRWQPGKHPATQSFQAIRMFINDELDDLAQGLRQAYDVLAVGGRLLVISFHSLEDRLVKQFIKNYEVGEQINARKLPIKNRFQAKLKHIGHAVKPNAEEIAMNPRSRSAILRIAEKQS